MIPVGNSRGVSAPERAAWLVVAALCCVILTASITILFLGGREIMALGGFVAAGGPYEIAHPAPEWVWLIPLSCVGGMAAGWIHALAAWRLGGFNLALIGWVLLFGSLGIAFLEAGVNPPAGEISWAWLLCGVVFLGMAAPAAGVFVARLLPFTRELPPEARFLRGATGGALYVAVNTAALVAGIPAGIAIFGAAGGL